MPRKKESFMFCAVDQATNISGWCVFTAPHQLLKYGIIDLSSLPKSTDQAQAEKRYQFLLQIKEIVYRYKIKQITTEGVYFHKNPDTHRKLAQTQGCLQDFCRNNEITCFSWNNAGEWRKLLSIKGNKRDEYKEQTKLLMMEMYKLSDNLAEDVYDAAGIGTAYFKKIGI